MLNKKTTYIVSGYMRTGTSMMMQALEAGGLKTAFNPIRNKMNKQHGDKDYKPNPGGFYELSRKEYSQYGFPRMYQGKLIKCLWGGLWKFFPGDYLIVFMRRDPEEIRQSYEAFFDQPPPPSFKNFKDITKDTLEYIKVRKDMQVLEINYRDVIDNPKKIFTQIKKFGFPININKATKVVDPTQYRFQLDKLTKGI